MRQHESEFQQLDARVKVVTFDIDFLANAYVRDTGLKWPLLLDQDQQLYKAYGLLRGGWWSIYGPTSIWNYLSLIFRGQRPGRPGKDWRQLGGDVLIDPEGIVRVHHISQNPHDRPSVQSILELISEARACTPS